MSNWTISVVQVPLGFGITNNSIVVRDGNGGFVSEIAGGPIDPVTGSIIPLPPPHLRNEQTFSAYTSGQEQVGVQVRGVPIYADYSSQGTVVFSGTQQQVEARIGNDPSCTIGGDL